VHSSNDTFNKLMTDAGRMLHLAEHLVKGKKRCWKLAYGTDRILSERNGPEKEREGREGREAVHSYCLGKTIVGPGDVEGHLGLVIFDFLST
jgi:hypothetical protein